MLIQTKMGLISSRYELRYATVCVCNDNVGQFKTLFRCYVRGNIEAEFQVDGRHEDFQYLLDAAITGELCNLVLDGFIGIAELISAKKSTLEVLGVIPYRVPGMKQLIVNDWNGKVITSNTQYYTTGIYDIKNFRIELDNILVLE